MARQWLSRTNQPLTLRDAMNRLFDDALIGYRAGGAGAALGTVTPQLDVHETEGEYVVSISLPGVKPDDVEVTVNQGTVTVRGELRTDEEVNEEQYLYRERSFGTFTRSITLPDQVQADAAEASFENGVLKLRLPKAEELRPRRIPIGGAEKRAIRVGEDAGEAQPSQSGGQEGDSSGG